MSSAPNSKAIISKSKNIFLIFFCISRIYIKLGILWKKRWALDVICFWNYRLQKAELLKCPKSGLSEHLWTVNMLKCPKHFLNLHSSIFLKFFDHSEREWARRTLFLVVSINLRLFVNTFTPDDKFSPSVKGSF